jgi:pilus assembly protein CpaB
MKSRVALLVSLGLGLLSMLIVQAYVSKKESEMEAGSQPRSVYVAADNIPEMVRLDPGMVQKVEIPGRFVQPEAIVSLDQIYGSVARVPIFKGAQLTHNMLLTRLETGLAMRVDPQRRAMAIAVSDVTGVAGLIQPGNRVDIYGTFKLEKGEYETVQSLLLLNNIKVLAVERRIGTIAPEDVMTQAEHEQKERAGESDKRKDEYPKNITVSVTPQEAIRLITAQESGSLTVVLRAQFEEISPEKGGAPTVEEPVATLSTQDLIGHEEKTARQRVPRYEQIRGNEVSY